MEYHHNFLQPTLQHYSSISVRNFSLIFSTQLCSTIIHLCVELLRDSLHRTLQHHSSISARNFSMIFSTQLCNPIHPSLYETSPWFPLPAQTSQSRPVGGLAGADRSSPASCRSRSFQHPHLHLPAGLWGSRCGWWAGRARTSTPPGSVGRHLPAWTSEPAPASPDGRPAAQPEGSTQSPAAWRWRPDPPLTATLQHSQALHR